MSLSIKRTKNIYNANYRRLKLLDALGTEKTRKMENHPLVQSFIEIEKKAAETRNCSGSIESEFKNFSSQSSNFKTRELRKILPFAQNFHYYIDAFSRWMNYRKDLKQYSWRDLGLGEPLCDLLKRGAPGFLKDFETKEEDSPVYEFPLVPMEIQRKVIPAVINGQSVFFHAPTGSGKTFSFLLPAIERLSISPVYGFECLIILSNSGLAHQTFYECRRFLQTSDVDMVTGEKPLSEQLKRLKWKRPAVLVATPARLHEILDVPGMINLGNTRMVVIDEVDQTLRCLVTKRKRKVDIPEKPAVSLLRRFNRLCKTLPQFITCSATYNGDLIKKLAEIIFNERDADDLTQILVPGTEKVRYKRAVGFRNLDLQTQHFFAPGNFLEHESRLELFSKVYKKIKPKCSLLIVPEIDFNLMNLVVELKNKEIKAKILSESENEEDETKVSVKKFQREPVELVITNEYHHRGMDFDFIDCVFIWKVPLESIWIPLYSHICGRLGRPMKGLPFLKLPGKCVTLTDHSDLPRLAALEGEYNLNLRALRV